MALLKKRHLFPRRLEVISKIGFSSEIKARPSLNPQVRLRRIEDLRRGLNAEFGRKDFIEMASTEFRSFALDPRVCRLPR